MRMIPLSALAGQSGEPTPAIRPLIESIRLHGIIHPLIVRRRDSQYVVVAGRKRLIAAQTLQIAAVPCLVHDLNDTEAAAMARVPLAGTTYIPGVTEERTLNEIKKLVERAHQDDVDEGATTSTPLHAAGD